MNNRNDELVLTNSTSTKSGFSKIVDDIMCPSDGSQGKKADTSKTMMLGA